MNNNQYPRYDAESLQKIKDDYPAGTRIKLVEMQDDQAVPPGTCGTVKGVDDMGDLLMKWDNGSGLKLIIGIDAFEVIQKGNS